MVTRLAWASMVGAIAASWGAYPAMAAPPRSAAPHAARSADATYAAAQSALDEQRYFDAENLLDFAALDKVSDPRLTLLSGELSLVQNHPREALADFRKAASSSAIHAQALQGQGIALAMLGQAADALALLEQAVLEQPTAWRAWNALASQYDDRADWPRAETAYEKAMTASGGSAIVLNNRGFSRLLQHRFDDAIGDLTAALQKRPDLAQARTNLRLTLAMKGDYERALAGGSAQEQARLLNNAGLAARLRGDYSASSDLLERAIKAKGEFYGLANDNLAETRRLSSPASQAPDAVR
jgi:Flp pilus assembly protein TadD